MDADEYRLMDEAEGGMWWYSALHARLTDALAPVRGRVLDAGCGTGGFLAAIGHARPDLDRTGVEYAPQAALRAAEKSDAAVTCGSVLALPFPDRLFDAAVSADVLCHAAVEPAPALSELYRVLRPGGLLVLNMPAYAWLTSAHDRRVHNARRIVPSELRAWLSDAGFTGIKTRFWNSLLLPLMIAQRKILARGEAASDVAPFSPWLNATLHGISSFERHLPIALPAGGSVLAIATRPEQES